MTCKICNDTGIDPWCSSVDGMGIPGYCDCKFGDELADKEMCVDCGEKEENCECTKEPSKKKTTQPGK